MGKIALKKSNADLDANNLSTLNNSQLSRWFEVVEVETEWGRQKETEWGRQKVCLSINFLHLLLTEFLKLSVLVWELSRSSPRSYSLHLGHPACFLDLIGPAHH